MLNVKFLIIQLLRDINIVLTLKSTLRSKIMNVKTVARFSK
jgi:hypothetical protein